MSGVRPGTTWQSEAQRPHQATYDEIARRKQEAFDNEIATRAAIRQASMAPAASATGSTREAAVEALRAAIAGDEAAQQRLAAANEALTCAG